MRFGGTHDSPNNIDIAVARSEDGGKNWSKPELPFHYEDYEDNTLEIPVGTQTRVNQSASFIDPVLLQDEETERVFLRNSREKILETAKGRRNRL